MGAKRCLIKKYLKTMWASYLCTFYLKVIPQAHISNRKFPMTNSGWISWSQVMPLPGLFPCRRLPASQISTPKAFYIYLYLAFLNIRWFLFSPVPPLYLLVFLFGAGLFFKAFLLYAYSDLFNEHQQKWAFQPKHHWDDAAVLL